MIDLIDAKTDRAADEALETLINRADNCLYTAKHSGRNRVVEEERGAALPAEHGARGQ